LRHGATRRAGIASRCYNLYTVYSMLESLAPSLTLDERVYGELRRAIVASQLRPGQELVVTTVAEQLGVSRIPVMHACQRLVGEGFLVSNPRRSFVVSPLTESRIAEGFRVLIAIESIAVEAAVRQVTAERLQELTTLKEAARTFRRDHGTAVQNASDYRFHEAIWNAAAMPYVGHLCRVVFDHLEPARHLARPQIDVDVSAQEHQHIIDAFERRDAPAAQEAIRQHRIRGMEVAIAALQSAALPTIPR
jgi:DNA-binding GntR family transcriptional regulator